MEQEYNDLIALVETHIAAIALEALHLKNAGALSEEGRLSVVARLDALTAALPEPVEVPE